MYSTKKTLNYLGYPFNYRPYCQVFLSLIFLTCLVSDSITQIVINLLLIGNGIYLVFILKEKYKTERPYNNSQLKIDYYPESYDIPSGHSFFSVYWLLILLYKRIPYTSPLIFYLSLVPFSRFMLGVHTVKAVCLGSVIAVVWFLIWLLLHNFY